ncbi:50S ribosomal protein L29 [Candidatus Woesearchaeota archaeon]|nr:50S ribosomal protein L29 [Candidatus Woesearchaeota archaeon]
MKANEIRGMDVNLINEKISELKKELMKMNAQVALGASIKNPGQLKKIKKTLARIITIQSQKDAKKQEVDKKA